MYRNFYRVAAALALALGLAIGGTQLKAQAGAPENNQHGRREQMSPDQQLDRMSKALNLTDDQKQQIRPILQDRQEKMQSIRSDTSLSREDRMNKMRSTFEESTTKIRAVLNDEQKQKFDQMLQRRREQMQNRAHEHGNAEQTPDTK
jgi:Spy/CpxP family protein refolding chaperone